MIPELTNANTLIALKHRLEGLGFNIVEFTEALTLLGLDEDLTALDEVNPSNYDPHVQNPRQYHLPS